MPHGKLGRLLPIVTPGYCRPRKRSVVRRRVNSGTVLKNCEINSKEEIPNESWFHVPGRRLPPDGRPAGRPGAIADDGFLWDSYKPSAEVCVISVLGPQSYI